MYGPVGLILSVRQMRSVADELKAEDRQRVLAMSPAERVTRALVLGRRAQAIVAAAQGLTPEAARRSVERQRQAGRRRCRCIEELIG
jgi:hypothetical protein